MVAVGLCGKCVRCKKLGICVEGRDILRRLKKAICNYNSSTTPDIAMLCPGHLIDARELVLLSVYLTLIKSSVDFQFEFYLGGTELKKAASYLLLGYEMRLADGNA